MLVTDPKVLAQQSPFHLDLAAVNMVQIARTTPDPAHFEECANGYQSLLKAGAKPVSDACDLLDENVVNATKSLLADKQLGRQIAREYLAGRPMRVIFERYG